MPKLSVDNAAPQEPLKEQVNNNHKYRSKLKPKEKTGNKRPIYVVLIIITLVLNPVLDRLQLFVPNLALIYMITLLLIQYFISPLLNSCIGALQAKLPLQFKTLPPGRSSVRREFLGQKFDKSMLVQGELVVLCSSKAENSWTRVLQV